MKADLTDIRGIARETSQRALHHAMALEMLESCHEDREESLWGTAAEMAMDSRGVALMTLSSAMAMYCADYRRGHARTGPIDIQEDEPGPALTNHRCQRCGAMQKVATSIEQTFGQLWRANREKTGTDCLRELHAALLAQVHMAVATALNRHSFQEGGKRNGNAG